MSDYEPIGCALHDQYEIAIMQGSSICLQWQGEDGSVHKAKVVPQDIQVRDGVEYLLAQRLDTREALRLRLDRVRLI